MLDKQHFEKVLQEACDQVFSGKGVERHGHGLSLDQQPWKTITDNVGIGFALGQSIKKLMELKTFDPVTQNSAWRREALGAVVYTIMAIMYTDSQLPSKYKT